MNTNTIIETKNLTKQYGSQKSVADLNIHVKRGRIYGLLGRNGAGKTTTMKMLLGLTNPTSGEVKIWGKSLQGNEKKLLPRIGSLIESPGFYPNLTGTENLRIFATLRGVPNNHAVKDALDLVGLPYKDTLLLPIVFAAINRSLLTGVSFAMCFIAMTTGYTFSITEKNSMDRLFGILPVRKSELVIGRYVFVLAMGLLSLIISLIAQPLVLKVLGETVGVFDIVTAAIAGVFLFALYTVFQIPGYYKYGSIKGRVFMYIPVAGFLVTLLLLSKMPAIGNSIISSVESSPILPVLIVFFSIVAMYAVSIILSIRIMKKKEM